MGCGKCGKGSCFCPVTLGLALGLTCSLGLIIWSVWSMYLGVPSFLEDHVTMQVFDTWGETLWAGLWALIRGFVAGFFFALIYNFICCVKSKCCGNCSCCK